MGIERKARARRESEQTMKNTNNNKSDYITYVARKTFNNDETNVKTKRFYTAIEAIEYAKEQTGNVSVFELNYDTNEETELVSFFYGCVCEALHGWFIKHNIDMNVLF